MTTIAQGGMATFHYVPLHSSPQGRALGHQGALPVTDSVAARLLRLPLHPRLGPHEVARVTDAVAALHRERSARAFPVRKAA